MERGSEEYNRIIDQLVDYCNASGSIDQNLYVTYDVKRGLRDSNGKGVLTGLTEISDVIGYDVIDGERVPADGSLFFQGYNVESLVKSSLQALSNLWRPSGSFRANLPET